MASPPFNIDQAQPAQTDQGLAYPGQERPMRDIVESWIEFEHHNSGRHTFVITNTAGRNAITTWEVGSVMYNTDHVEFQTKTGANWEHSGFQSGVITPFRQTAAPTGWTLKNDAKFSNAVPKMVTSGGTGNGGSAAFATTFNAAHNIVGSVADHTLALIELPFHTHSIAAPLVSLGGGGNAIAQLGNTVQRITDSVGGGQAHGHTWSGTTDLNIKFMDIIVAERNTLN